MIYTLTLNPAVDNLMTIDSHIQFGETNRSTYENSYLGGKGLNVSVVLQRLGIENVALGYLGGFTGEYIKQLLDEENIKTDFTQISGQTRINTKLISNGVETQLNSLGPKISKSELQELINVLKKITKDDLLVLSGSLPDGVPSELYTAFAKLCASKNIPFIVDATGQKLLDTLEYEPFLIKPNASELEDLFNREIDINNLSEIAKAGLELKQKGARNVLVSLGGNGSILLAEDGSIYHANAAKGEVVDTVGAGDSMIAGFLASFLNTQGQDLAKTLKYAAAAGGATAFSKN